MPVSMSGVILGATTLPKGVSIGLPPAKGLLSWGTVWQLAQSDRIDRYLPRSTVVKSCASTSPADTAPVLPARATNSAAAPANRSIFLRLRIDQRSRLFEILVSDGVRRPIGECTHGQRRVVAGVLWEGAGAEHEQVRDVPTLEIPVYRAGPGIGAHDHAPVEMSCLVRRNVVGGGPIGLRQRRRAHRLDDLGELVGQIAVLLRLVFLDVYRHPHQ